MSKIILKINPETQVIEDIGEGYAGIPQGYTELELHSYPNDLLGQYYKFIDGAIVKDETLYAEFLEQRDKQAQIDELRAEIERLKEGGA